MNLLFIYQDPTPYNIDLFNELAKSRYFNIHVIYTVKHDCGDGAHIYNTLPTANFSHAILNGNLTNISVIYKKIKEDKNQKIILMGYTNPLIALTSIILFFGCKKFISEADGYNISKPKGEFILLKILVRNFLRFIITKQSDFLLCAGGKKGKKEAIAIGFHENKVIDFPYTISSERVSNDIDGAIADLLNPDIDNNTIIFVSARFIERKGHKQLIDSLHKLTDYNWFIWFEGVGPLMEQTKKLVISLGLEHRVRFLGFCEMRVHNWLLSKSNIVIVPSLNDPWGIVVDEAMKLGKITISTVFTGSAVDRIKNRFNGFIYNPLDPDELSFILASIFEGKYNLQNIKLNALETGKAFDPIYNRINLENAMNLTEKSSN